MVIINPSFATQPAAFNRPAGPAPVLAIDRVLTAVVVGQRAEHLYELASGNLKLMAESQTALRHGEKLLLQVTGKDHKQRPQLQILKGEIGLIQSQLRAALPQQQSVSHLLANLGKLSNLPKQHPLATLGKEFIEAIASKAQSSNPAELRQAIMQSGLFLESQLAQGKTPTGDLKQALLKLSRQITTQLAASKPATESTIHGDGSITKRSTLANEYAPQSRSSPLLTLGHPNSKATVEHYPQNVTDKPTKPELPGELRPQSRQGASIQFADAELEVLQQVLRDVRGSLARQESHQLLHLQQSDKSQAQYMVELPIRGNDGIDVWQLHLHKFEQTEHEQQHAEKSADKPQHNWAINLSFDLPGLGPICVRVSQAPELDIRFTAENKATSKLIERKQHELVEALEAQGVNTQSVQCLSEKITINASEAYSKALLDTQA